MGIAVDFLLISFLVLQTWIGWRTGLLRQAASMASLGFGVVMGLALAPSLGARLMDRLTSNPFHAKVVAFLFVLGAVALMVKLMATSAEHQSEDKVDEKEKERRRGEDRVLGGVFAALKACVLCLVLVAAGVSLWPRMGLWQESKLAPHLAVAGSRLLPEGSAEEVRRWVQDSAGEVAQELGLTEPDQEGTADAGRTPARGAPAAGSIAARSNR